MMELPSRPQPKGWWTWANVHEALRLGADEAITRIASYPGGYDGRGIVIVCAGKSLAAACFTARVLRRVGCRLPIQLWHCADEQTGALRRTLKHLDVTCVNADDIAGKLPFRFLHGQRWKQFQLKPYAIAHSPFREVLLLDAGCSPTRNPEFLFDWPDYREYGAAFWPDALPSRPYIPADVWEAFGIQPGGPRLELNQLLIDKKASWAPLQLAMWYNAHADLVYNLVWCDKDTFKIAWSRLGRRFAMPEHPAVRDLHTILQHGPDGKVLLRHRCADIFRRDRCFSQDAANYGGRLEGRSTAAGINRH
jgi:hypothetical protein